YWAVYREHKTILQECLKAPDRWTYSDLAIAPPLPEELDTLELYNATRGGNEAVAKKRKEDWAREALRAAV
ncbi:MAG TPA: radical SAM protein, partial [Methyloceanibacter sp.]|nr:radical SAM protein [Methyloceanibacter sp.]